MGLLTPKEFVQSYSDIGIKKSENSFLRLFILGILAGLFIGFGAALSNLATHTLTDNGKIRVISGLVFPVGLIMVILSGAELFTGNCLITISILNRQLRIRKMLRNLLIVYFGNFVGSLLLAVLVNACGHLSMSGNLLAVTTMKVASAKCSLSFGKAMVSGILCNILVCCAVMLSLCAKDVPGRVLGAYVPVFAFVSCGFEHSIANMYYIPAGIIASCSELYQQTADKCDLALQNLNICSFLINNLIPVTLGNIIGGVFFAACIWIGHHEQHQL